jgi:septum formation protein
MLHTKFKHTRIILASQSPRRQELLKGLDLDFIIKTRPVNEVFDEALKESQITDYLAQLKAKAFYDLSSNDLLITSDTIVWIDNKALGKPKNHIEASEMLAAMSGKMHQVFTSVCFTTASDQWIINDETKVYFKALSSEEIEYYVDSCKPFDRAGGYGIQDWMGYTGVDKIDGCYYNVMGLPLPKVYSFLKGLDL